MRSPSRRRRPARRRGGRLDARRPRRGPRLMPPFPGGPGSTANGTLILSLAMAVVYLYRVSQPSAYLRTATKAAAIALLAVLAAVLRGPGLLIAALALAALGDALLAEEDERPFLAGLAFMLGAHLALAALFVERGEGLALLAQIWRPGLALAMTVAVAAATLRLWRAAAPRLRLCAAALVVLATGLAALTLDNPAAISGAVLLLASDGLLAVEATARDRKAPPPAWAARAGWVLHYAALTLIALGVLLHV